MNTLREAAQQALEALTHGCPPDCTDGMTDSGGVHPWGEAALVPCPTCTAIADLRAALAEPQEPIAWGMPRPDGLILDVICPEERDRMQGNYTVPLYAAPQPRKRLTDKQLEVVIYEHTKLNPNQADDRELIGYIINAVHAIEAAVRGDGK